MSTVFPPPPRRGGVHGAGPRPMEQQARKATPETVVNTLLAHGAPQLCCVSATACCGSRVLFFDRRGHVNGLCCHCSQYLPFASELDARTTEVGDVIPCVGAVLGVILADTSGQARLAAKKVVQQYKSAGPMRHSCACMQSARFETHAQCSCASPSQLGRAFLAVSGPVCQHKRRFARPFSDPFRLAAVCVGGSGASAPFGACIDHVVHGPWCGVSSGTTRERGRSVGVVASLDVASRGSTSTISVEAISSRPSQPSSKHVDPLARQRHPHDVGASHCSAGKSCAGPYDRACWSARPSGQQRQEEPDGATPEDVGRCLGGRLGGDLV